MRYFLLVMTAISAVFGSTEYVKVEVAPRAMEMQNGKSATFELRLKAEEGIHINARPAVTVESETRGVALSIEEIGESGDRIDLNKPLKVNCKLDGIAPGIHRVDFLLNYTYCSDKEQWCRLGKDSLSIEITVDK